MLLLLIKNIYFDKHLTKRAGEWYKKFNPVDFPKQDYFFWPNIVKDSCKIKKQRLN